MKIVVDIEQGIVALGGELHADAEALLLNQGSKQSNLWGANYYPFKRYQERLEYTALINIRPRDNNFTMEIESSDIRKKIVEITTKLLLDKNDTLA